MTEATSIEGGGGNAFKNRVPVRSVRSVRSVVTTENVITTFLLVVARDRVHKRYKRHVENMTNMTEM